MSDEGAGGRRLLLFWVGTGHFSMFSFFSTSGD